MAAGETLRVGDVVLDLAAGCLRGSDGTEIALRPKSFDLLAILAGNPRRTLSRDNLLDAVWPGVTVTEESVTQCVREVRRAIGDPDGRLLRTVARRGYRLDLEVVPVTPAGDRAAAAPSSAEPSMPSLVPVAARLDKPSIAVLAFDNMSGDPDQEYFSDGVADDIITELSRSRFLFVIARNSSFTYKGRAVDVKQVARELGVRYVLEGSVRRGGGRLRISAQLIDAEAGHHLWAERYDRDDAELFSVQDEITTAVTTAIHPAVADAELRRVLRKPPESLGAWDAYQRGLWLMDKYNAADTERAIDCFTVRSHRTRLLWRRTDVWPPRIARLDCRIRRDRLMKLYGRPGFGHARPLRWIRGTQWRKRPWGMSHFILVFERRPGIARR